MTWGARSTGRYERLPTAPLRFCVAHGCNQRVVSGYCPQHAPAYRQHLRRFQSSGINYGRKWRLLSKAFLYRHPLCVHCQAEGKNLLAEEVDHIQPHRGDADLFWNQDNWQPLCKSHHSAKTAREAWGGG